MLVLNSKSSNSRRWKCPFGHRASVATGGKKDLGGYNLCTLSKIRSRGKILKLLAVMLMLVVQLLSVMSHSM